MRSQERERERINAQKFWRVKIQFFLQGGYQLNHFSRQCIPTLRVTARVWRKNGHEELFAPDFTGRHTHTRQNAPELTLPVLMALPLLLLACCVEEEYCARE